ncbi:hypothetical protein V1460_03950 [Streptomyces sp. SCSIO 30461]|uniref:hypothetical protein n=1 Tax=Streptomyces sp. SCSIO 30461 TaxID=3118085 RepID=UPI0030CAB18C
MRAPSTVGTFPRAFAWGQVRLLDSATRAFTWRLAAHTGLVSKTDKVVFVDIPKSPSSRSPARRGRSTPPPG